MASKIGEARISPDLSAEVRGIFINLVVMLRIAIVAADLLHEGRQRNLCVGKMSL